ncbi:MAG: small subunit ribosomal protein S1 [Hyphomicrobiaceae bacterium]|jgi:small subunit ribosomal protein S1
MEGSDNNENEDFAAMFAASETQSRSGGDDAITEGKLVSGTVVSISAETVFVSLGGKAEGVLETTQVTDADGQLTVKVGDTVRAHVVDAGERTGVIQLRCKLGRGAEARDELQLAAEHGIPVEGLVSAVNDGGFEVQVAGLRAFCPVSQIDLRYVEKPETFVDQRLEFRITRFEDKGRGEPNIVLSRRVLLQEDMEVQSQFTRAKLEVGAVFPGIVRTIREYGAFVDIGGIEGMLHISELGYHRVEHPSEILSVDQKVEVQVIKIETTDDPRKPEKIALSLKALTKDPWETIVSEFPVGHAGIGRVMRIEPFGAFVELKKGIEGLVHISEMGGGTRVSSPRKVVTEGEEVRISVLSVDPEKRRISLSIDAAGRAERAADERAAIDEFSPSKQGFGTFGDLLANSLTKKS